MEWHTLFVDRKIQHVLAISCQIDNRLLFPCHASHHRSTCLVTRQFHKNCTIRSGRFLCNFPFIVPKCVIDSLKDLNHLEKNIIHSYSFIIHSSFYKVCCKSAGKGLTQAFGPTLNPASCIWRAPTALILGLPNWRASGNAPFPT